MAEKRIPDRNGVLAAIRRAAENLGRAPSWNELRSLTGVPESRVRVYFSSLADAVRAAGLEPGRAGLKLDTEDLLQDFARVARKLGRTPSRNEYVRLGKYSAGAFYARFRSWDEISKAAVQNLHHGGTQARRATISGDREESAASAVHVQPAPTTDSATQRIDQPAGDMPHESDKAIAMQWAGAITAIPAELAGKRRVTDAFCAMIVGTLLGPDSNWQEQLERYLGPGKRSTQQSALSTQSPQPSNSAAASANNGPTAKSAADLLPLNHHGAAPLTPANGHAAEALAPAIMNRENTATLTPATVNGHGPAALAPVNGDATETSTAVNRHASLARVNGGVTSGGLLDADGDRPVMGPPFYLGALTNAPINELGVVFLFGMMAGDMGFQVQSLRGQYPDCRARRQIQPGKWQDVNVEFEYESLNFLRHGHDPAKCNVIVCWRHNWKNCPEHIEVIELSRIFGMHKPTGRSEA